MSELGAVIFKEYKEYGLAFVLKHIFEKTNKTFDLTIRPIIAEATKNKPLLDMIIIESHNDFDCNGGAFYNYLIDKGYNKKYKIIWLVKNSNKRKKLPNNVSVYNIKKFSLKKNYSICRAKYLLCDDIITDRVRDDQISVYCTHGGCTFKNVRGKVIVRDSISAILSSSLNFDPYMCDNYSIPYPNSRMIHIGFPSNDVFFENKENEFDKISKGNYSKRILWMPTFRKGGGSGRNDSTIELPYGIPLFEKEEDFEKLNKFLLTNNMLLIIKLHPMQDLRLTKKIKEYSNIFILDGSKVKELNVDNYRLMASSDAFISDYSSAPYSYLLLDRPIAFVTSDIEFYKVGFTVDNIYDFMPGKCINTYDDFVAFLNDINEGNDEYKDQRRTLTDWMYEYKDGKSCDRLASFLNLSL